MSFFVSVWLLPIKIMTFLFLELFSKHHKCSYVSISVNCVMFVIVIYTKKYLLNKNWQHDKLKHILRSIGVRKNGQSIQFPTKGVLWLHGRVNNSFQNWNQISNLKQVWTNYTNSIFISHLRSVEITRWCKRQRIPLTF